ATHRPADRAGEERLQRELARGLRRHDPAARLHHVQRYPQALLLQRRLEAVEVAAHDRRRVRVEHGRRRALVLAPLAGDSVRERDGDRVAELLEQHALGLELVRRLEEREEERDRDGAETLLAGAVGRGPNRVDVERLELLAGGVPPAPALPGGRARDE